MDIQEAKFTLNTGRFYSEEYRGIVDSWPDDISIWDYLETPEAKKEFIQYILLQDDTDSRAYESFEHKCTGFAAQMTARYSSYTHLSKEAKERINRMGVEVGNAPKKFNIPLMWATTGSHSFNAVLMDNDTNSIGAYLFFEPQTDELLFIPENSYYFWKSVYPDTPTFVRDGQVVPREVYWMIFLPEDGLKISTFTDFNESDQYIKNNSIFFPINADGDVVTLFDYSTYLFVQDFHVLLHSGFYQRVHDNKPFQEFIKERASKLSDKQLLIAGQVLVGKTLPTDLTKPPEIITWERYLEIIGRPDL